MAGSSGTLLDHHFEHLLQYCGPLNTVLDIGPGQGKYGRLCQQYQPQAFRVGLEIYPAYVEQFGLRALYDEVRIGSAAQLLNHLDQSWDLVIMGDVLEHMPKSQGLDVLHFLVYRARYLWLQWPIRYLQGPEGDNPFEAHISVWGEIDVLALHTTYRKFAEVPIEAYAVNGYPNAGTPVEAVYEAHL